MEEKSYFQKEGGTGTFLSFMLTTSTVPTGTV